MLRSSLSFNISKTNQSASVTIPELLPGINFFPSRTKVFYSIIVVLGVVPDLFYQNERYLPSSAAYAELGFTTAETPWSPVNEASDTQSLVLQISSTPADETFSVMLSIGIRYGVMSGSGVVEQLKHTGSAKVVAVV